MTAALAFELPDRLEAHAPPARRDCVRLLVAACGSELVHARFRDLPRLLAPGDLLVVNTSATVPAALTAVLGAERTLDLHLSTPVPDGDGWVVELRDAGRPFRGGRAGAVLALPAGGRAELLAPYLAGPRLWVARLRLPEPLQPYLARHGRPIRYPYVPDEVPLAEYQTVFAGEPGSAEMPSAGRPFTPELVTELAARGIVVAPLVLHTGVSSLEEGERPYPEWFRVPAATARLVNATRAWGGRVIAVGTTVVRALESAVGRDGSVAAAEGWTGLVVTPRRALRAVDGLLTGWHEPGASHLQLLEAVAGRELVERSYAAALRDGYLWHEFGDSHLLLPWAATAGMTTDLRIEHDGVMLAATYSRAGDTAIAALHGASEGTRDGALCQHLHAVLPSAGTGVVTFDRRGEGQSTGDPSRGRFDVQARDALAVLDAVDADQVGLRGYSQGGWVAPLAARRIRPGRIPRPRGRARRDAVRADDVRDPRAAAPRGLRRGGRRACARAPEAVRGLGARSGHVDEEELAAELSAAADEPWWSLAFLPATLLDEESRRLWIEEMDYDRARRSRGSKSPP